MRGIRQHRARSIEAFSVHAAEPGREQGETNRAAVKIRLLGGPVVRNGFKGLTASESRK
jgi:hypothetical protein